MIIINTTFVLDPSISAEALDWVKNTYAASAPAGLSMLARIIADENDGGYALHLSFDNMDDALEWDRQSGAPLRQKLTAAWGEKALSFCTFLETIG